MKDGSILSSYDCLRLRYNPKENMPVSDLDVLAVAKLSPFLAEPLHTNYRVHDRLHETDPQAFATLAPRIRAIAASGESKVGAELIGKLPALEIISVMGVGYD